MSIKSKNHVQAGGVSLDAIRQLRDMANKALEEAGGVQKEKTPRRRLIIGEPVADRDYFTQETKERILSWIWGEAAENPGKEGKARRIRWYYLTNVMFYTGCRMGEALLLRPRSFKLDAEVPYVDMPWLKQGGDTIRTRAAPLIDTALLLEMVKEGNVIPTRLAERPVTVLGPYVRRGNANTDMPLFLPPAFKWSDPWEAQRRIILNEERAYQLMMDKARKKLHLEFAHSHMARHTFIRELYASRLFPMNVIMGFVGHKTPGINLDYAKVYGAEGPNYVSGIATRKT